MSGRNSTVLDHVAAELKARFDEAEHEPMPANITAVLFEVYKAETAEPNVPTAELNAAGPRAGVK
ncbi:MAG: hypothetical protein Q7T86_01720 [Hyphomicrobiaceae bacterium]|nr:hypothetical protein [Hyphomicrobiaceae bacterium]